MSKILTGGTIKPGVMAPTIELLLGTNIVSASTISTSTSAHKVTGSTTVNTINPPYTGFVGEITLVAVNGFSLGTSGNVASAVTLTAGQRVSLFTDGITWYPMGGGGGSGASDLQSAYEGGSVISVNDTTGGIEIDNDAGDPINGSLLLISDQGTSRFDVQTTQVLVEDIPFQVNRTANAFAGGLNSFGIRLYEPSTGSAQSPYLSLSSVVSWDGETASRSQWDIYQKTNGTLNFSDLFAIDHWGGLQLASNSTSTAAGGGIRWNGTNVQFANGASWLNIANDAAVVHLTGNETVAGTKTFADIVATKGTFSGDLGSGLATLTDAANIATNANNGNVFTVTLAGNRTLDNPTNLVAGHCYTWIITQDGTGSRTLAYGTLFRWPGGSTPVLSTAAGAVDMISGVYDGIKLRCVFQANI
jgi:hypothetical protein